VTYNAEPIAVTQRQRHTVECTYNHAIQGFVRSAEQTANGTAKQGFAQT
jgi:hypothetical protein